MICSSFLFFFFFFNDTATTEIYTLSLHDALPILEHVLHEVVDADGDAAGGHHDVGGARRVLEAGAQRVAHRSEEHTSELQSPCNLVCRLLLEKKKKKNVNSASKLKVTSSLERRTY